MTRILPPRNEGCQPRFPLSGILLYGSVQFQESYPNVVSSIKRCYPLTWIIYILFLEEEKFTDHRGGISVTVDSRGPPKDCLWQMSYSSLSNINIKVSIGSSTVIHSRIVLYPGLDISRSYLPGFNLIPSLYLGLIFIIFTSAPSGLV